MTFYYEDVDKVVNGNAEVMADNSEMYVKAGVTIGSKNGFDGVEMVGNSSIELYGAILSIGGNAILATGFGNEFYVGATGSISGSLRASVFGLLVSGGGSNHVVNDGSISGNTAISLKGHDNVVDNAGSISSSHGYAIDIADSGGHINNSGTITASDNVAIHVGNDFTPITIDNSGTITGGPPSVGGTQPIAIQLGAGAGTITNSGHIVGDIALSESADAYYGGEGTMIGSIDGGGGDDIIVCGAGRNVISGRDGADELEGGAGRDTFVYTHDHFTFGSESTGSSHDTILDFDARKDLIEIDGAGATALNAKVTHGTLSDATFNTDLAAALPKAALKAHHAVLFTPDAGTYKGETILVIDDNGKAGYQADKDFVIVLDAPDNMDHFGLHNFI